MSIVRMTKICIMAPRDMREELVDRLHYLGIVELRDIAAPARDDEELKDLHTPFEPETRDLRLAIAKTDFIIQLLENSEAAKSGFISGFLKEKLHLTYEEFLKTAADFDLEGAYREAEELDIEIRKSESASSELEDEIDAMRPWKSLDLSLGEADKATSVELRFVITNSGKQDDWQEDFEEQSPHSEFAEVGRENNRLYLVALVHKEEVPEFDSLVSEKGWEHVQFAGKTGTLEEEISCSRDNLAAEKEKTERLKERIREMIPLKRQAVALNEYLHNKLAKEEAKKKLIHTKSVIALQGWVEESRIDEVKEGLKWLGQKLDVFVEPPNEGDIPPTVLQNRRRVRPAETIIDLFGAPSHSETDPTIFVAPFFIIFFAMCIGDVGYGIILALAFWIALKKLDVSKNAKKFLRLFMYCGMATIVAGILTRGYFGIEGTSLPGFLKFTGTLDVLNNPVPIMLLCAALGLIHISIGVAIEMRDNMRNNSSWLGICEQGTTLLFWLGIAVTAVGFGIKVHFVGTAGLYLMVAGIAGIILLSNIAAKSIAGKFFGGLYNMYGLLSGTIGDVASYLRLYALGLATVAIGSVVNRMAVLTLGIPILGIVFLALILLGGHTFNIAINFLGAFVHPLRLQYVEFFGKFYEDGGAAFDPLALKTNKLVIDDH